MNKRKIKLQKSLMYIISGILIFAGVIAVWAYPEGITADAFIKNMPFFLSAALIIIITKNWKKT